MTLFRPCIDLHQGSVKQIVGGSLRDDGAAPETNFVASENAAWFAERYREDELCDGHVIMLGPGNEEAARGALAAFPGGLQVGGGIDVDNASSWLSAGASKVIVTSWLFEGGALSMERVDALAEQVGRDRLVIDLSCRRTGLAATPESSESHGSPESPVWKVATNRWQTVTNTELGRRTFDQLADKCCEFLIHAADVEGQCRGIDEELVGLLGRECPIPCTYAGGARDLHDLDRVAELSEGRVHLTFGSALDLFGGTLVRYADCVAWNRERSGAAS
jgi:phosphoribosylformimino-5-aminoimidazole carboxamide ribotide isomerase